MPVTRIALHPGTFALAVAAAALLAGCGLKGPLTLPERSSNVVIRSPQSGSSATTPPASSSPATPPAEPPQPPPAPTTPPPDPTP